MKTETQKFVPRPAYPDETMLFFDISEEWNTALGAIGYQQIRLEGGGDSPAAWQPQGAEELRTPEFIAEMDALLDELRKNGLLKSAGDLREYCREHGGEINSGLCEQGHGYIVDTEKYRYCLLCEFKSGEPQVYLHAYDRQVLEQYEKQSFHKEDMREFIVGLLGEVDPAAMEAWISYASALQQEGTEMTANFYRDLCGELEYIKDRAGEEIARQLFDEGREFTLNPFEFRTAALLLVAGTPLEEITRMSVKEDLFSPMQRDSGSFPQPMDGSESRSPVGRVIRADAEPREYTGALEYTAAVKRELQSDGAAGLRCETLTDDPLVRKVVDMILGGPLNEQTPMVSSEHTLPPDMETASELEAFNRTIEPFYLSSSDDGNYWLSLRFSFFKEPYEDFCGDVFDRFAERHGESACDKHGLHRYGSGYDWDCVFQTALKDKEGIEQIHFDSEAGSFFCYSDNRELLKSCAVEMRALCQDTARLTEVVETALLFHVSAEERVRQSMEQFPPGTRVQMRCWDDAAGKYETMGGSVESIDDDGVVHLRMDNGKTHWCDIFYSEKPELLPEPPSMTMQMGGIV